MLKILFILSLGSIAAWHLRERQHKKEVEDLRNRLGAKDIRALEKILELREAKNRIEALKEYKGYDVEKVAIENLGLSMDNKRLRKRIARLGKKRGRR